MKIRIIQRFVFCTVFTAALLTDVDVFAQQLRLGDNLGSHKATKDLDLASHNISGANLVNAKGVLIGTATTLSNNSIALQVDGADKAILVPRVTNLLSPTTPSIPVANAVNGMIVYDLATSKFYHRQNNAWVAYVDVVNYVDRFLPQVILGKKTFKSDSGFVAKGTFGTGAIPELGAGTRMMFYPAKAAFRVGAVDGLQWDDANVGNYSVGMGNDVTASALGSTALGNYLTTGANAGSFIIGDNSTTTVATTQRANQFVARFAGGFRFYTTADTTKGFYAGPSGVLKYKADYSTAYDDRSLVDRGYVASNYALKGNYVDRYLQQVVLGQKTFKSDSGFVAQGTFGSGIIPVAGAGTRMMWYPHKAAFRVGATGATQWEDAVIGNYSVAMGNNNMASGISAVALGNGVSATGNYASAIGSNVTAAGTGSFIAGDNSSPAISNAVDNRFAARYAGGYRFYTSADTTSGFYAIPAGVVKYKADYSAVYDDRSLVDRGYLINNYALKANYVDRYAQQVVLGQKTFKSDSGFVAQGTFGSGLIPATGAGTRMMWYPRKAAFRVGSVSGTAWDDGSVGNYSIAMGNNNIASGIGAVTMGTNSNTTGNYATAIGNSAVSSGIGSVAMGNSATASGDYSLALGRNVNGGAASSVAIGNYVNSTATGAMSLGDNSVSTAINLNVANRFAARFAGGYRFHTSADTTRGFFAIPAGVLKYKGDYSSVYDDRSLVDRAYVIANFTAKSTGTGTSGSNSLSTGSGTTASGANSVASGSNTSATGSNSQASGQNTSATGTNSFVYGSYSTAEAQETLAGGYNSHATGYNSVALGTAAAAGGSQAIALGVSVSANGNSSLAFGQNILASQPNSVAIGNNINVTAARSVGIGSYLNVNAPGVVMLGDSYDKPFTAEGDNQMLARFAGGYVFYTAADRSTVSRLGSGQNSWSTTSDKRLKTNFEIADAESFLLKIDTMKLGSWNYKSQDAKQFRHYGPMAQDFYGAFGKDSYGTIGCDTLIASADFDGVNMIAIKGLVSRTNSLTKENTDLHMRIASLESANKAIVAGLVAQNEILNKKLVQQAEERNQLQTDLVSLRKLVEGLANAKSDVSSSSMLTANGDKVNRNNNKR